MKTIKVLMWVIVTLLLIINFLSFHDIFETHSLRDWLTLLVSILIFIYFVKEYKK